MKLADVKHFISESRILRLMLGGAVVWELPKVSKSLILWSSTNFTVPQGIVSLKITMAGGGGGAAGSIGAVYIWGGGGGGGGGRVVKTFTPAELEQLRGKTFAVIVGAAGLYQGDNNWGGNGGTSQFQCPGFWPTAYGGNGGQTGSPGVGGAGSGGENGDEILTGGNGGSGSVGGARGSGGHGQEVGDVAVAGTHGCGWGGGSGMPTGLNGAQGAVLIEWEAYE